MLASFIPALPVDPSCDGSARTRTGIVRRAGAAGRPARRTLRRIAAVAATSGLLLVGAGAASAHVSVEPASTTEGGYSQLTFSVPSESTDTTTNKIEVALPTETPFTSVRVKPVEGWTSEVIRGDLPASVEVDGATLTEAPLTVIWTAKDEEHQLNAQQYQTFSLSVGTLPEAGTTVQLPVTQSYADGTVRVWDEPAIEGEEEPENPAPSFVTTASDGTDSHGAASTEATEEAAAGTTEVDTEQASTTTDMTGTTVGWIGLGAGVLGLLIGALALARTRGQRQN
ncbi:YcnI family protein [Arthrobacter sp. Soc17.1.1.1]|uniref:YcnI family copper-binding membrane protein n=1 Tax=Arthrobacter sp. Soc17.1.1.1 TaxID=3121277 RepID=UPI002FE4597F